MTSPLYKKYSQDLRRFDIAVAEYSIGTRQIISLRDGPTCALCYELEFIPHASQLVNIKITNLWDEFTTRAGLCGGTIVPDGPYYADYDKARGVISGLNNELRRLKGKNGCWAIDLENAGAVLNALDLEYLKLINE